MMATAVGGKSPLICDGQEVCVLQDVLYMKGLARNLVCIAAASRNGMKISFKGASCVIRSRSGMDLEDSRADYHIFGVCSQ